MQAPTSTLRLFSSLFLLLVFFFYLSPKTQAAQQFASASATIKASVPATAGPPAGDTTPPDIPILVRPIDGTHTNNPRPELVWLKVNDPNSNTVFYDLYLNGVATYLGISNIGNSSTTNYTTRLENNLIHLLPNTPLADGTYEWKVVAYDLSQNQRSSATWRFTIDTKAPPLQLVALEHINYPDLSQNPVFHFKGPRVINFKLGSEPYVDIILVLYQKSTNKTITRIKNTQNGTTVTFPEYLALGEYQVLAQARDLANNTISLIPFTLIIESDPNLKTSPAPTTPSSPSSPLTTPSKQTSPIPPLEYLPSTVMLVSTRLDQSLKYLYLLAIPLFFLLIFRQKHNVRVLNSTNDRVKKCQIIAQDIAKDEDHTYTTNRHGENYIKDLKPKTTLTFTHPDYATLTFCLYQQPKDILIVDLGDQTPTKSSPNPSST